MKKVFLLFLSFITALSVMAGDITPEEALQQAQNFLQKRSSTIRKVKQATGTATAPRLKLAKKMKGLYVFNVEDNKGFVIVSSDDRAVPILGYSDSGAIDPDNMPANMQAWLQGYADQIAWLQQHNGITVNDSVVKLQRFAPATPIANPTINPLLTTTWDQGSPYNNLCPEYSSGNRSATGCVATAMAQVMKYHEWPTAATTAIPGYTSPSYNIDLTAGLPATTFDWANMKNSYLINATGTAADAVATLMQYCGYSVQMDYGPESGANTDAVAKALKNYFGYNTTTTQFVSRSFYTTTKWANLIYHELANNRPVVYGGMSSGGGHEFVCDGYKFENNTDFFHINWGWGGDSDDYFVLSALDPDQQGIGGSSSDDGFHFGQDAVIGIQPSTGTGTIANITPNVIDLTVNSMTPATNPAYVGVPVDITLNITNHSADDYEGDIFIGNKYTYQGETQYELLAGNNYTIAAGETKDIVIPFAPYAVGAFNLVFFLPNELGSYSTDGEVKATLTAETPTTNEFVPVYGYYCDNLSRSAFIIPAANIEEMCYGTLNSVTFYAQTDEAINWGAAEFDVYLGETNKTTIDITDLSSLVAGMSSLEKVYSGSLSIGSNGQMKITFSTPYQYMGGNLMVGINQTKEGDYAKCSWIGTNVTGASVGGYNTSISQRNFLPNTTFDYTPGEAPAVAKPTGVTVNYTGGDVAEVSWISTESAWDIDVNGTVTEDVTNPYTLTNLALATNYTVKVRAKNGSEVSDWSTPATFTTDLSYDNCQISFALTDSYGDGWNGASIQVVDVLTGTVLGTYTNENLNNTTGNGTNELNTHLVTVPNDRDIQFVWVSGSYDSECSYTVYDVSGDVIFSGSGAMSNPVTYHVNCTVTPWRTPTNLAASEIGPKSAILSWTENSDPAATAWVVAYKMAADADFTEVNAATNPFTLTNLAVETEYTVKVRPATDEATKWSKELSFITDIATPAPTKLAVTPAPTSAAFTWKGFADSYDVRYTVLPSTGFGSGWLQYDNGTFKASLGSSSSSTWTWGVMYSAVTGNRLTKVSFYENASYNKNDITVSIYAGDTPSETPLYSEVVTPMGTTGFHEVTLATPVEITPNKNLWIALTTTGTYAIPYCDSSEPEPNNQWIYSGGTLKHIGDLNSDLASYGWMIRGYFESTTDPESLSWAEGSSNEESYTITELTPETNYVVQVRGDFGSDGKSEWATTTFTTASQSDAPNTLAATAVTHDAATLTWTGYQDSYNVRYRTKAVINQLFYEDFEAGIPSTWTTIDADDDGNNWLALSEIPTTYPDGYGGTSFSSWAHSGSDAACSPSYVNEIGSFNSDHWLITPQLNLQGTLKFYAASEYEDLDSYEVLLSTTGKATTDFTTTLQAMTTASYDSWDEVSIDLSSYHGQQGYIAIHHVSSNMYFLVIDDFGLYESVSEGEWQTVNNITEPTLAITGLSQEKIYEWQVQGNLEGGGTTDWSNLATFTTLKNLVLNSTADNSDAIEENDGQEFSVTLSNFTLYKDGYWNTLCLPFAMTAEQVTAQLAPLALKTLSSASFANGTLTLNFTDATTIEAGKPYLIKWESNDNIVSPTFRGVTIDKTVSDIDAGVVVFKGLYAPLTYATGESDNSILFMKDENTLYYPDGSGNTNVNAFHAYFALNSITAGEAAGQASRIVLNLGNGETTGITTTNSTNVTNKADGWYTLDGRRLNGKPTQKGVYIQNGRKTIVK